MESRIIFFKKAMVFAALLMMAGCSRPPTVQIHYLGHASFLLQFDNGLTVLTDYGVSNSYGLDSPIYDIGEREPAIVTYSHDHADHHREMTWKQAEVLTNLDSLSRDGLTITPIRTCEADLAAADNTSYLFTYKGLKILHLADAQAYIKAIEREEIRERVKALYPETYDILLMTIEGPTQFIPQAESFIDLLQPARVIPMHYWSPEYKSEFLEYLQKQGRPRDQKYRIDRTESADYIISGSKADSERIQIISLTPAVKLPW